jgi:uncharacterized membrane protein
MARPHRISEAAGKPIDHLGLNLGCNEELQVLNSGAARPSPGFWLLGQFTGTSPQRFRWRPMQDKVTYKTPPPEGMSPVLERNIHALVERRHRERAGATAQAKLADAITAFVGSMTFVYLHLAAFGFWIAANLQWIPGLSAWDPSFVVLGTIASVEAIFLSTFVLISQNRMAREADKRADLDLQISLLTEHELTKVADVLNQIAHRLQIESKSQADLDEASHSIAPERVLDKIEETNRR